MKVQYLTVAHCCFISVANSWSILFCHCHCLIAARTPRAWMHWGICSLTADDNTCSPPGVVSSHTVRIERFWWDGLVQRNLSLWRFHDIDVWCLPHPSLKIESAEPNTGSGEGWRSSRSHIFQSCTFENSLLSHSNCSLNLPPSFWMNDYHLLGLRWKLGWKLGSHREALLALHQRCETPFSAGKSLRKTPKMVQLIFVGCHGCYIRGLNQSLNRGMTNTTGHWIPGSGKHQIVMVMASWFNKSL